MLIGIGELAASRKPGDEIRTLALGSCVAVVLWCARTGTGGMVHVALPSSALNPVQARRWPGRFADTGMRALLAEMAALGCNPMGSELGARLIGGASVVDLGQRFHVGRRNAEALRAILRKHGIRIVGTDLGGHISRSVSLDVGSGVVRVFGSDHRCWEV